MLLNEDFFTDNIDLDYKEPETQENNCVFELQNGRPLKKILSDYNAWISLPVIIPDDCVDREKYVSNICKKLHYALECVTYDVSLSRFIVGSRRRDVEMDSVERGYDNYTLYIMNQTIDDMGLNKNTVFIHIGIKYNGGLDFIKAFNAVNQIQNILFSIGFRVFKILYNVVLDITTYESMNYIMIDNMHYGATFKKYLQEAIKEICNRKVKRFNKMGILYNMLAAVCGVQNMSGMSASGYGDEQFKLYNLFVEHLKKNKGLYAHKNRI